MVEVRKVGDSKRSLGQWVVAAVGLAVLVIGLAFAVGPYQMTREFREVVDCDRGGPDDCFGRESARIRGRRTYTTTHTDSNGQTHRTRHYEVTWERDNAVRQTREVPASFYRLARKGEPANLRIWRDDVVSIEVMGGSHWFLPQAAETLRNWLLVAWFGLGVLLLGLLFRGWDGFFMFAFRGFIWMFLGLMPLSMTTHVLAYGWGTGPWNVFRIGVAVVFTGIGAGMLRCTLGRF